MVSEVASPDQVAKGRDLTPRRISTKDSEENVEVGRLKNNDKDTKFSESRNDESKDPYQSAIEEEASVAHYVQSSSLLKKKLTTTWASKLKRWNLK